MSLRVRLALLMALMIAVAVMAQGEIGRASCRERVSPRV